MGGETAPTAQLAVDRAQDLFRWFKWSWIGKKDRNFDCVKATKHAKDKETHTHPVDMVFHYVDPYLNKRVYLNTDLKSYSKNSINATPVRNALRSLATAIDCARVSEEWQQRYKLHPGPWEVRGLLFVYNHDAEYDRSFHNLIAPERSQNNDKGRARGVALDALPLSGDQYIHIIDPLLVHYMSTIKTDVANLHYRGKFPESDYSFLYPELHYHRAYGAPIERPATVELISGPYMVIKHGPVRKYNEEQGVLKDTSGPGYVVYYNRSGYTPDEFVYLLDGLFGYQMIDGNETIRIRMAHHDPHHNARSNFLSAVEIYVREWGFDSYKEQRLRGIEFEILPINRSSFSREETGWERKDEN